MGLLSRDGDPSYPDLRDRVAIVTGADRRNGIGAAVCRALARQGCHLLFTSFAAADRARVHDRDDAGPAALARELSELGVRAERLEIDLARLEAPAEVLERARHGLGPPSILINNAAHSARDGYRGLDAEILDAHHAVNVRATALLSVGFARGFAAGQGGRIVNLVSGQGLGPMPGELAYAASKGAIEAFTRTLAHEVAPLGITVNAVDPGATDTGWMDEELRARLAAASPRKRVGTPEDAARLIAFLASAAGAWISGQVLHSRGG